MERKKTRLLLLGAFAITGCESGPYVIGRFADESCEAHQDAVVCSGFEQPESSDFTRTIVVAHAKVEQTDSRAYQGAGALHASSKGAMSAAVVAKEFTPIHDGELYLRAHFYVPDGLPTKTMNIMFIGDYATPDPFKGVDFNLEDGALSTYVPQDNPARVTSTTLTIPRSKWFCMQVHLTVSADAGALTVDIDGAHALEETGMNTAPKAGIHLLRVGVDWSSDQADPFDFYVDNLVLDRAPIDCD